MPLFLGYMLFPECHVLDSQLADIADQHELKTGYRSEVIFSACSFGIKSTTARRFHSWLWFGYIGFPENAEVGALMQTITGLRFKWTGLYVYLSHRGGLYGFLSIGQEFTQPNTERTRI